MTKIKIFITAVLLLLLTACNMSVNYDSQMSSSYTHNGEKTTENTGFSGGVDLNCARERGTTRVILSGAEDAVADILRGQSTGNGAFTLSVYPGSMPALAELVKNGRAADLIRDGREDVVICGGIDIFTELTYSGFNSLMAISKNKCHPLTVNRDGMSLGDACATLILESYDSALRRGAPIYGEIKGYCTLNEAYHATAPKPDGEFACKCMWNALADAGLDISDVDYVNSHGTGTVKNDTAEICGLETLFAGKADKTLVNSTKGMTGHCLGAAGSIEAIICLLSIRNRTVYADDNGLPYPDSEKLDFVAKNRPDVDIRVAVSNSFGFGGNMASIVISKI